MLLLNRMGIKGLRKVMAAHGLVKTVPLDSLRGRTVGVDVSLTIYQLYAIGLKTGLSYDADGKGSQTYHHVVGIFYKTVKLLQMGITPVYFFDGPPPAEKAAELEIRRATRQFNVPNSAFEQVREICNLMGVECVVAPSEAEAQAVRCQLEGSIYGVLTEDTDVIALGGRQITIPSKGPATVIDGADAPAAMGLTREQFVDFCILSGCDYSTTLPGVGPQTAIKLLKQYGDIESIPRDHPAGFNHRAARAHLTAPVVNAGVKLTGRVPMSPGLTDRLVYYGMSKDRIVKSLKKLE
jgi:flap endonuclease-1